MSYSSPGCATVSNRDVRQKLLRDTEAKKNLKSSDDATTSRLCWPPYGVPEFEVLTKHKAAYRKDENGEVIKVVVVTSRIPTVTHVVNKPKNRRLETQTLVSESDLEAHEKQGMPILQPLAAVFVPGTLATQLKPPNAYVVCTIGKGKDKGEPWECASNQMGDRRTTIREIPAV